MKYTKYFSGVLRNHGVPNLNVEQFAKLMNIVSLESRMQELLDFKESNKNREDYYKYDVRINSITNKIKTLTLDVLPKVLMQNMILKSK
jgi:hypothetical protein